MLTCGRVVRPQVTAQVAAAAGRGARHSGEPPAAAAPAAAAAAPLVATAARRRGAHTPAGRSAAGRLARWRRRGIARGVVVGRAPLAESVLRRRVAGGLTAGGWRRRRRRGLWLRRFHVSPAPPCRV